MEFNWKYAFGYSFAAVLLAVSLAACNSPDPVKPTAPKMTSVKDAGVDKEGLPKNIGRVSDYAKVLNEQQIEQLARKLKSTEPAFQTAVLIVKSLDNKNIEDYAHDVFKAWKLGTYEKDNGVLLILAMKERKVRIQTGFGTESKIIAMDAGAIVDKMTNEALSKGKIYEAIAIFADGVKAKGN